MSNWLKRIQHQRRWRALAMGAVAGTALHGCMEGHSGEIEAPPPPVVEVAEVLVEPTVLWDSFTGRVAAPETVELRPRVNGYIDRVAFAEGELVEQGDVLFEIDPRPYAAAERAAQAELARAKSDLELADSQARRAQQLLNGKAISAEEHDQRNAAKAAAEAAVHSAEAALQRAELDLQYTVIRAPISGRVGRALITRGNLASANQSLLTTLVSVNPMYVYFETDQQRLLHLRELSDPDHHPVIRVGLAGENGLPHLGHLDFVDNTLNGQSGTIQLRAVVDNSDGLFRAGQFARVEMPTEQLPNALLIDRKAVLTDQDRRYVYVVDAEQRAQRRVVEPGREMDDLVVIRDGLASGDRIIVNGLQRVMGSGITVQVEHVPMNGDVGPQKFLSSVDYSF